SALGAFGPVGMSSTSSRETSAHPSSAFTGGQDGELTSRDMVSCAQRPRSRGVSKHRIAADIGGTFTDIALLAANGILAPRKLLSTPGHYADAVIGGIAGLMAELGLTMADIDEVLHGCTVAANAILEGKGARTSLLTTKGFRDVLELRRIRTPR